MGVEKQGVSGFSGCEDNPCNLCSDVEDNSKQAVKLSGDFYAYVDMIQNLYAKIADELGQKAAQLEAAHTELERLKAEEADRVKVVDRLSRENSKLKDKCDECDSMLADKDAEIARVNNKLKEVQEKCSAKDSEIAELNKERQNLKVDHDNDITKLKNEHETAITNLEKKYKKEASAQIESANRRVNEIIPPEVCTLFDYHSEPVDNDMVRLKLRAIYAYLLFINDNFRQDAFMKRFREFDAAFYDAMHDKRDLLTECRGRVQKHINEELGKKTGGLLVCWPKIGEAYNPDQYTTTSEHGQRISEVISAMIYKKGDDGKVVCQSKGKVATE